MIALVEKLSKLERRRPVSCVRPISYIFEHHVRDAHHPGFDTRHPSSPQAEFVVSPYPKALLGFSFSLRIISLQAVFIKGVTCACVCGVGWGDQWVARRVWGFHWEVVSAINLLGSESPACD